MQLRVLQLRLETIAVLTQRNMVSDDYYSQMIPRDECGICFLIFVLQLLKTPGEIKATGDRPRARWVRGK